MAFISNFTFPSKRKISMKRDVACRVHFGPSSYVYARVYSSQCVRTKGGGRVGICEKNERNFYFHVNSKFWTDV